LNEIAFGVIAASIERSMFAPSQDQVTIVTGRARLCVERAAGFRALVLGSSLVKESLLTLRANLRFMCAVGVVAAGIEFAILTGSQNYPTCLAVWAV